MPTTKPRLTAKASATKAKSKPTALDKNQPLMDDIRLLGRILGDVIREQEGGRTLTMLNLKRMLRGQDPDQKIQDRDILFVPDSTAKNLLNRTMESAVQSAIGVTIYSALVYSQRY